MSTSSTTCIRTERLHSATTPLRHKRNCVLAFGMQFPRDSTDQRSRPRRTTRGTQSRPAKMLDEDMSTKISTAAAPDTNEWDPKIEDKVRVCDPRNGEWQHGRIVDIMPMDLYPSTFMPASASSSTDKMLIIRYADGSRQGSQWPSHVPIEKMEDSMDGALYTSANKFSCVTTACSAQAATPAGPRTARKTGKDVEDPQAVAPPSAWHSIQRPPHPCRIDAQGATPGTCAAFLAASPSPSTPHGHPEIRPLPLMLLSPPCWLVQGSEAADDDDDVGLALSTMIVEDVEDECIANVAPAMCRSNLFVAATGGSEHPTSLEDIDKRYKKSLASAQAALMRAQAVMTAVPTAPFVPTGTTPATATPGTPNEALSIVAKAALTSAANASSPGNNPSSLPRVPTVLLPPPSGLMTSSPGLAAIASARVSASARDSLAAVAAGWAAAAAPACTPAEFAAAAAFAPQAADVAPPPSFALHRAPDDATSASRPQSQPSTRPPSRQNSSSSHQACGVRGLGTSVGSSSVRSSWKSLRSGAVAEQIHDAAAALVGISRDASRAPSVAPSAAPSCAASRASSCVPSRAPSPTAADVARQLISPEPKMTTHAPLLGVLRPRARAVSAPVPLVRVDGFEAPAGAPLSIRHETMQPPPPALSPSSVAMATGAAPPPSPSGLMSHLKRSSSSSASLGSAAKLPRSDESSVAAQWGVVTTVPLTGSDSLVAESLLELHSAAAAPTFELPAALVPERAAAAEARNKWKAPAMPHEHQHARSRGDRSDSVIDDSESGFDDAVAAAPKLKKALHKPNAPVNRLNERGQVLTLCMVCGIGKRGPRARKAIPNWKCHGCRDDGYAAPTAGEVLDEDEPEAEAEAEGRPWNWPWDGENDEAEPMALEVTALTSGASELTRGFAPPEPPAPSAPPSPAGPNHVDEQMEGNHGEDNEGDATSLNCTPVGELSLGALLTPWAPRGGATAVRRLPPSSATQVTLMAKIAAIPISPRGPSLLHPSPCEAEALRFRADLSMVLPSCSPPVSFPSSPTAEDEPTKIVDEEEIAGSLDGGYWLDEHGSMAPPAHSPNQQRLPPRVTRQTAFVIHTHGFVSWTTPLVASSASPYGGRVRGRRNATVAFPGHQGTQALETRGDGN